VDAAALKIVIGVTGGIAAYKIPSLIRTLRKDSVQIKTVITRGAAGLVGPAALQTLSGNPVYRDDDGQWELHHIHLAEWADYLLVCPATANSIAKLAHGIADNLLTTIALCFHDRLIVVPAMNSLMWENPATQRNISLLKERNVRVLPVDTGALACGTEGPGRMISVKRIAEYVRGLRIPRCFAGKKILISSGPTLEPVDPVRVLSNRSSGKMGAALSSAAAAMGAEVTVVSGPSETPLPDGLRVIRVATALEMQAAMVREFKHADICIMAAAVSDFRPKYVSPQKIDTSKNDRLRLELVRNPDILMGLGTKKTGQFLVGFSLETEPGQRRAVQKMHRKKCDMMVLNRADASIGRDTMAATILYPGKKPADYIPSTTKQKAAEEILAHIARATGCIHE
jgi:phosphopantothenoylcysteine decarboxylase/phosphopantothenate--cysteine ligase